jgi:integrase
MRNPGANMAKLDLPYVKQYRDHTGVMRRYFRRAGNTLGVLPGDIGSTEFMEAYQVFLGSKERPGSARAYPGTFGRLILDFYKSVEFANLKPNSQDAYRAVLEPLAAKHGHKRLALLNRDAARTMIQRIGDKRPAMANLTKNVLARVFRVAVDSEQWHVNPFARLPSYKGGTHHTWTEAELLTFEKRWPLGTRERLAYALLLYTGQRVGDVVKMHWRDVVANEIHLAQEKTDTALRVPIHSEITRAVRAMPARSLSLFAGKRGGALKRGDSLSMVIRKAVRLAGLPPRCKAHGLRKAIMRRLAEADVSSKSIAAVSGHKTLKEVERYTAAAEQPKLARNAMKALRVSKPRGRSV